MVQSLRTIDTVGNVLAHLIGWISARGNITIGLRNVRSTTISLRGDASVSNAPGSNIVILSDALGTASPLYGMLWVWVSTDDLHCEFEITNNNAAKVRETAGGTVCTTTLTTANSVNVGNSAGALHLENLRAGARTFGFHWFGRN